MTTPEEKNGQQSSSKKVPDPFTLREEIAKRDKKALDRIKRVIEKNQSTLSDSKSQITKMEAMIKSMHSMQNDIEARVQELKTLAAKHNIDIESVLGGANMLATKENQVIHAMENAIKKKIDEALLPEACLRPIAESKEALTKKRHGKTRGARNKWLPMR